MASRQVSLDLSSTPTFLLLGLKRRQIASNYRSLAFHSIALFPIPPPTTPGVSANQETRPGSRSNRRSARLPLHHSGASTSHSRLYSIETNLPYSIQAAQGDHRIGYASYATPQLPASSLRCQMTSDLAEAQWGCLAASHLEGA